MNSNAPGARLIISCQCHLRRRPVFSYTLVFLQFGGSFLIFDACLPACIMLRDTVELLYEKNISWKRRISRTILEEPHAAPLNLPKIICWACRLCACVQLYSLDTVSPHTAVFTHLGYSHRCIHALSLCDAYMLSMSFMHSNQMAVFHLTVSIGDIFVTEVKMADDIQTKLQNYRTAPFDARFPNSNQTRNCWSNYLGKTACQGQRGQLRKEKSQIVLLYL